eukprot:768749-Hanusia_phi.AAC.6
MSQILARIRGMIMRVNQRYRVDSLSNGKDSSSWWKVANDGDAELHPVGFCVQEGNSNLIYSGQTVFN